MSILDTIFIGTAFVIIATSIAYKTDEIKEQNIQIIQILKEKQCYQQ